MTHLGERRVLLALSVLLTLSAVTSSQEQPAGTNQKRVAAGRLLKQDGGVPPYKGWLEEDVAWIIADEERAAFKLLKSDEQRDQFVEAFWARRNPIPDSLDNEYKIEHYRRIIYANDHFNARIPGWATDRGRIYIVYGPPEKVESYPSQEKTLEGDNRSLHPVEVWNYRYLDGIGLNVAINFVDICDCGDYRMKVAPKMNNALLVLPSTSIGNFDRRETDLRSFVKPAIVPVIEFQDLEALLNSPPPVKAIPFEVQFVFEKATTTTSLVSVTIALRNRDLTLVDDAGLRRGKLNLFGRFSTLTGHVAEEFEDSIEINVPKESDTGAPDAMTYVRKTFALHIGRYRLGIAVKDATSDQSGTWIRAVVVPYH